MLQMCPVCVIERDGCIPAQVVPIPTDRSRYGNGHIEATETLGEVLDRLGVSDAGGLDTDQIVLAVRPVDHVFCGGRALYWVGIAKHRVGRVFGEFYSGIYISERDDGTLRVAVPA